ncbi:growth factor receptor domain-containing protein [Auriculariales sp. MPI-PUGE-AT-0066]|nr:growth factor receptor domain-containing protein [Auriculariales sp. MPI-PUGE-AT-0066]
MLASVASLLLLAASAAAQSTTTLCVPGQCLDGTSNISIGATVSTTNSNQQFVLLPGTYASNISPDNLRTTLSNTASRLNYATGFAPTNATGAQSIAFPVTIALQPGFLSTSASLFRGQTQFHSVPATTAAVNETRGVTAEAGGSLVLSSNVWAAFTTGSADSRLVVWDSVADLAQLPSGAGQSKLTLVDLQSTTCTPSCSGNGVCTAAGTCVCPEGSGFTGKSCETCLPGFFGPQCLPCPEDCDKCDEGATGSGQCLVPKVTNAPSTCSCVNGLCGANGACACNEGWQDGTDGTKCSICKPGFFKATDGSCQVCDQGCERCQDSNGTCTQCTTGLTNDANNARKCVAPTTSSQCGSNTFPNPSGTGCLNCSPSCATCFGAGPSACLQCALSTYKLDGLCVPTDNAGVCSGSKRVANNAKNTCDACTTGCAECGIPNFASTSTFDQLQCTKCLPGSILSDGKCVETCPTGTFISADGSTCAACDSSCSTCAGDAKFCLTCSGTGLAQGGTCGTTCPTGTFKATGACLSCHGDCTTCSGAGFDQCTSCSSARPVLSATGNTAAGRCLPTCSKSQFFDATSNKCQACDSACSSCSGSGPNQCLACSSSGQALQGGTCVDAKCERGSSVVPGLGACLSALVAAPFIDNTPTESGTTPVPAPAPTVPGRRLSWWEILLMALGCAFIFMVFLMCWRRRMRKRRAAQTAEFARNIETRSQNRNAFSRGMHWLGGKFFRRRSQPNDVDKVVTQMRAAEVERHKQEMELLEAHARGMSTGHAKWEWTSGPSVVSDRESARREERSYAAAPQPHLPGHARYDSAGLEVDRHTNRLSAPSLYSVVTGIPRAAPEPRQPYRPTDVPPPLSEASQFSRHSNGSSIWRSVSQRGMNERAEQPSYDLEPVRPLRPLRPHRTGDSFESHHSNSSSGSITSPSRNPFRRP